MIWVSYPEEKGVNGCEIRRIVGVSHEKVVQRLNGEFWLGWTQSY